ncbi:MAG: DUF6916 family protein [Pyrinomonadaceae bacterium]
MSVSRRRFLRSGALGALSAGLILKPGSFAFGHHSTNSNPGSASETPSQAAKNQSFNYSRANFEPHVGSTFRVDLGNRTVNLKLIGLADYQPRSSAAATSKTRDTESFVLAFRTPRSLSYPSSIYKLEHSAMGKFDLFMTRSEDHGSMSYMAVINRIV